MQHVMGTHDDWELKSYFKFSFVSNSVELNLGLIVQSNGWTISPEMYMYPCEVCGFSTALSTHGAVYMLSDTAS